MRSELYEALRTATEGEFALVGELDCDAGWIAYLATAAADGSLALLLLHRTPDGDQFDLQVAHALDGSLAVGKTTCPACGTTGDGWPRFCGGCRRDLSGVAPDAGVPGSAPAELLEDVREAAAGVYEVLGAMHHAEGGGAMYFAREDGGRIVGLVLEREADGDLSLVHSWAYDHEALSGREPDSAAWTGAPAVPAEAEASPTDLAPPAYEAPSTYEAPPAEAVGTAAAAAALLYDEAAEPGPRRRRGAPSRRVLYGAAGALLMATGVTLALVVLQRSAPSADASVPILPAPSPAPTVPSPSVQPVDAFAIDTATPVAAAPAATESRRTRPARPPRTQPVRQTPPKAAEPPTATGPTPEEDRQAVINAVARYANAVESRQMDRVRAAYPGISGEETARWTDWFSHFGRGENLSVSYAVVEGPVIEGDVATMTFTLTMRYQRQHPQVTSRATLRRAGNGWTLQALNTPR